MQRLALACLVATAIACSDSPTAPSPPTPGPPAPPAPAPQLYTVTGMVTSAATGQAIANATVRIADGPNAGQSAVTDGSGRYAIGGLTFAGFSIGVTAPGFLGLSRGIPLGTVTTTIENFALLPEALWTQGGAGNTVFNMPSYFSRVRIVGVWNQTQTSNFIVRIGGRLVVNEILRNSITYDGVHLTNGGGIVEITNSNAISWSFTEQR